MINIHYFLKTILTLTIINMISNHLSKVNAILIKTFDIFTKYLTNLLVIFLKNSGLLFDN